MDKISLIIADANESVRNALSDYFKQQGDVEVLAAVTDGREAVEKTEELCPDALIIDIVLPGMDGLAVLERVVCMDKRPVVIVYSAFSTESFVTKSVRLGADYFMAKPSDLSMIKDRLKEVCVSRRMGSSKTKYAPLERRDTGVRGKSLEERVTNIFITVGIPPHIKGYSYLREAVKLSVDDPEIINSITKRLYPSIAVRFETSASKVERAIRHAIEVAWNRGKMENVNSLFGIKIYSNNEKPTNGEFIALIADKMLLEGA